MKSSRRVFILIFLAGLLVLGGLSVFRDLAEPIPSAGKIQIQIKGVKIYVELAILPDEQARGLGGRSALPENQGMLFLYDTPAVRSFWMKDMQFPIDIVWIDENYAIIDITRNIPLESFPASFQPSSPAQYVLEINAGLADRNNIRIGDAVDFSGVFPAQKFKELVFAEDAKNHQVIVLSRDGEIVKRIKVGEEPHDIAVSPDQKFVATSNFGDGTVSIINTQTLRLEKTFKTGAGAHGVAFDPAGNFLFVANAEEDTLSVIEAEKFSAQEKIKVGSYPEYVGVTASGTKIFITHPRNKDGDGTVTVLENRGFDSRIVKKIQSGIDPHGWTLSPDGKKIVITTFGSDRAYLFDSATFEEIGRFSTGADSEFATFLNNDDLWITNIGAHTVSIVDLKQNAVIGEIAVGETPHGISFSSDKTLAFVPLYDPGEVVIIDVAKSEVIKRIKVGEELHNSVVVQINEK